MKDFIVPPAGAAEINQPTTNIQTPPLPNTPMPNRQVASVSTTQKNPITGLTQNQEALLSPTEKVIARKR